jgi:hypothetical protein
MALPASTALAADGAELARGRIASMAYSPSTTHWGRSSGFLTQVDAEKEAVRFCAEGAAHPTDCRALLSVIDGCLALAVGANKGYGTAGARTVEGARSLALQWCGRYTTGCQVVASICSDGSGQ